MSPNRLFLLESSPGPAGRAAARFEKFYSIGKRAASRRNNNNLYDWQQLTTQTTCINNITINEELSANMNQLCSTPITTKKPNKIVKHNN